MRIDIIPIPTRACDLCNTDVTDIRDVTVRSFVLTSWGAICLACWDDCVTRHADFYIVKTYAKSQRVNDPWIKRPMAISISGEIGKRDDASMEESEPQGE